MNEIYLTMIYQTGFLFLFFFPTWTLFSFLSVDWWLFSSAQVSSVTQPCPTLCNSMSHSMPGLPVHHQLPELSKLMSIKSVMPSSHLILCRPLLLLPPIPPNIRIFPMSQLFDEVAKVLEFQLHHQSFQWRPKTDLL